MPKVEERGALHVGKGFPEVSVNGRGSPCPLPPSGVSPYHRQGGAGVVTEAEKEQGLPDALLRISEEQGLSGANPLWGPSPGVMLLVLRARGMM